MILTFFFILSPLTLCINRTFFITVINIQHLTTTKLDITKSVAHIQSPAASNTAITNQKHSSNSEQNKLYIFASYIEDLSKSQVASVNFPEITVLRPLCNNESQKNNTAATTPVTTPHDRLWQYCTT